MWKKSKKNKIIYFKTPVRMIEERVNRIRYQSSEPNWTSEMYYYNLMTP